MNAKLWAISIILVIPVFIVMYYLSKDLVQHEKHQEKFLSDSFPQKMFMTQEIPIKKYALITLVTLGLGGIYWLYKIVNNYNAHFEAQWKIEKEINRLMEEEILDNPCRKKRFVSHGGDVWGFSRKYNIPVDEVLDFSGPVNFLGPSPKAVEAVKEYAKLIKFYPDPKPDNLKKEVATYVGQEIKSENIILGNGSIELIYMITEIFDQNFKAIIPIPSFTEYEKAVLRTGGNVIFSPLTSNFEMDIENIKKAVTQDTKIIYVCNPHSPSGTLHNRETILHLAEFAHKKNIIVCVDENYIEFTQKGQDATVAGYIKEYNNLFVIRSVTKFFGMPGIRFGYAIASEDLIDILQTVRQPWTINGLAGQVTLAAINDKEFIETTKKTISNERTKFSKKIGDIEGLHVYPSETNFLLVKITSPKITSTILKEEFAKNKILIRDCSTFVGLDNTYFRVNVRSAEDNAKVVKILKEKLEA